MDELKEWKADFAVDEEDRCIYGYGHRWVEVSDDRYQQILECTNCHEISIGYKGDYNDHE